MTGWATVADCTSLTGVTPSAATLALAQGSVETHVGRTVDSADAMTLRDLEWLRRAVAWQAAWIPSQPGYLSRVGSQGVSQDGLSAQFNSPADLTLAPLTQRALKNVSWMGTRSIRVKPRAVREESGLTSASSFMHAGADPESGWSDL